MDSATRWTARLEIIAPLTLLACGLWVFVFAPTETEQGFVQKIMYIHVPSVIVTYLAFFVTFAFGIAYLWKRLLVFDRIAKVSAEIGLIFCAMVLLSGAIWGRPTWGTYWVEKEARFASVLGIIGFLDIPIVHKSVEWRRTLHQPSTLFKVEEGAAKPAMPPELLYPLLASMLAMLLFYGYLMLLRWQMEENPDQLHEALAQEVN